MPALLKSVKDGDSRPAHLRSRRAEAMHHEKICEEKSDEENLLSGAQAAGLTLQ